MMDAIPVIAVNGFLESGKTFFLNDAIDQETFIDPAAKCVLICCEEGECEYNPEIMKRNHTTVVTVDEPEQLTEDFYRDLIKKYHPNLFYIEENVMWDKSAYAMPKFLYLAQQFTVVDCENFSVYMNNMRQRVLDMLTDTQDVIMYNCNDEQATTALKRSLKMMNPKIEFMYFDSEGNSVSLEDDLPYKIGDYITVDEKDFGIFYVDSYDNIERYNGKTVELTVTSVKERVPKGYFVAGRKVMTCCANDIQFLGFPCKNLTSTAVNDGDWMRVTGTVKYAMMNQEPHLLLEVKNIKKVAPPQEEVLG